MSDRVKTAADLAVAECVEHQRSFALVAGAGSGKTSSLVDALKTVVTLHGDTLRKNGQKVACITYTKRAVDVIRGRLMFDDVVAVSTLHSFLWGLLRGFDYDIQEALRQVRIPALIAKAKEDDNGGKSQKAKKARARLQALESDLVGIKASLRFDYADSPYGDYALGKLGHDDIVELARILLDQNATFRKIVGHRFPYIFVDEAQDTFDGIVAGLNKATSGEALPLVGYFGDPWQQIYDGRASAFTAPGSGLNITKAENFRCSKAVIRLLNAFRDDVEQYAAGKNQNVEGSVEFVLIQSEDPELKYKRYSPPQLERSLCRLDNALEHWGWRDRGDVVHLYLVRQMIARRLGFAELNLLFTGQFASTRAQEAFKAGEHSLLKPLTETIFPLVQAARTGDDRAIVELLSKQSPAFSAEGENAGRLLRDVIATAKTIVRKLCELWDREAIRDVLLFCRDNQLVKLGERLAAHLDRAPRQEEYDEEVHNADKGDWLADAFLSMTTSQVEVYADFLARNTVFSTQHGVKGEEYRNVLVVFDDVEAAWSDYSFLKSLTPGTSGEPTDGQRERGRKLAYVCFSRAVENLRVVLFTPQPNEARTELIARRLVKDSQISIIGL